MARLACEKKLPAGPLSWPDYERLRRRIEQPTRQDNLSYDRLPG